jgi:hypothetical protein
VADCCINTCIKREASNLTSFLTDAGFRDIFSPVFQAVYSNDSGTFTEIAFNKSYSCNSQVSGGHSDGGGDAAANPAADGDDCSPGHGLLGPSRARHTG